MSQTHEDVQDLKQDMQWVKQVLLAMAGQAGIAVEPPPPTRTD